MVVAPPLRCVTNSASAASLVDFRGVLRGEPAIVSGWGESLNLLQQAERVITIGVNDVDRRFTPNYLVVVNPRSQFTADRFRYVESSEAKNVLPERRQAWELGKMSCAMTDRDQYRC